MLRYILPALAFAASLGDAAVADEGYRRVHRRDPAPGIDLNVNLLGCKLNFALINGLCVPDCSKQPKTYLDVRANKCVACADPDATTCTANGATACGTLYLQNGKCAACPAGQFGDNTSHTCKPCSAVDPDAATCDATQALSCSTKYLKAGKCTADCGEGFYVDAASHTCKTCTDSDAATCDSVNALSCKTKYLQSGHCVASCAAGSFGDDGTHTCKACSSTFPDAKECTAQGPTSCSTPGNIVVGNRCIAAVRISLFPNYYLQGGASSDSSRDMDLRNGGSGVGRGACSAYCSGARNTPYSYGRLETYASNPGSKFLHCHCSGGKLGYLAPTADVKWISTVVGTCQATSAAEAPGNEKTAAACVDAAIVNGRCARIGDGSDCESFFG